MAKSKRRKIVRAADLPPPRPVSDEDFDEICATSRIGPDMRGRVRRHLDEILDRIGKTMRGNRLRPDRQADRDRLRSAAAALEKAWRLLEAPMGEAARSALPMATTSLGAMITARWLRERFPADELTPEASGVLELRYAVPVGEITHRTGQRLDIEEDSLQGRIDLAQRQPAVLIVEILQELERALRMALSEFSTLPGARGGREPLISRRILLVHLAIIWRALGRRPATGPESQFTHFCESVLAAVGWPTTGVVDAVQEVLDTISAEFDPDPFRPKGNRH